MNLKEKSLVLDFSGRWLIDLILMVSFLYLLSIPLALAREAAVPVTAKDPAQPVVLATGTPELEKSAAQTLAPYTTVNSVDFLMESSTLSRRLASETGPSVIAPEPPPVNDTDPKPVTLPVLQGTVVPESDEVAMLVSEQCSQNGSAAESTSSCARVYSNGHRATVLTQNANEGDELKTQTVIEEFDSNNILLHRKTIRHRVDYNYLKDKKAKEKELFDIIYQPTGKKTTRELMVYEYFLDTGKAKSLSWTQYQQIASEPKAELAYHALLRYGDDGSPDRGLAERWNQGKKTATFMNWSRHSKGFAALDKETWGQWEGWIRNVSPQSHLPQF